MLRRFGSIIAVILLIASGIVVGGVLFPEFVAYLLGDRQSQLSKILNAGFEADKKNQYGKARECFNEALQLNPHIRIAHIRGVSASIKLGEFNVAMNQVDGALELFPNDYLLLEKRGDVLTNLGRLEEAVMSYEQSVAQRPLGYWTPWLKLAAAQEDLGRVSEARSTLCELLELCPGFDEANARLSELEGESLCPTTDAHRQ